MRNPPPSDPSALVRKGVQFDISYEVWEKFKELADRERVTVADLIVELVIGWCAQSYSSADAAAGRSWPSLIGGPPPREDAEEDR